MRIAQAMSILFRNTLAVYTAAASRLLIDKCGFRDASVIDIMNKGGEHNCKLRQRI
jgi:hypothetical protein